MEDKQRIEQALDQIGLTAREWRDDPDDGLTAVLGRFEVVNDMYNDEGIYAEDVGIVEACVVGAAEYRNQRVSIGFKADGTNGAIEIPSASDLLIVLDPVD